MPNWVLNKVYFYGEEERLNELKKFVEGEENAFDFDKILHMPESLNIDAGSTQDTAVKCAKLRRKHGDGWKDTKDAAETLGDVWTDKTKTHYAELEEYADKGEIYLKNKELYGAETWYEWHWEHWGTKWNSVDACWTGNNFVTFDTAWNMPEGIYRALAKLFPDVGFSVCFADEDVGRNCGTVDYCDDLFSVDYKEDYEFACEVLGFDPNEEFCEEYV